MSYRPVARTADELETRAELKELLEQRVVVIPPGEQVVFAPPCGVPGCAICSGELARAAREASV